jgi:glioma pathogenesis-related protein 2
MMKDAQCWAETLAKEDRFTYRQNCQYGENLYCLWSSDRNAKANAKDVCRSWYDEVREFTFDVEPRGMLKAGQFTQMVWKNSKHIGVGCAKTKKGKVIVVVTYHPRGNIIGQFNMNVARPKSY